jgi:allantoicase
VGLLHDDVDEVGGRWTRGAINTPVVTPTPTPAAAAAVPRNRGDRIASPGVTCAADATPRSNICDDGRVTDSPPDFTWLPDLALRTLGGAVVWANDDSFAEKENLIKPGPAGFQAARFGHWGQICDGWETRRRREPGHDDAVVRLGVPGVIRGVVVDTSYFLGNSPGAARVTGICSDGTEVELLPRTDLLPDTRHRFLVEPGPAVESVRLDIYPDGGLARLRVWGEMV